MYKQGEGGRYGAQAKRGGNVMILLIDNYDSFSYNLFQLVGTINEDIKVIRNDEMSVDEIRSLAPSHIILSPGPKRPKDAGVCIDVVKKLGSEMKILGVCLGHQSICEAYGGVVGYAKNLMHGKQSRCEVDNTSKLFKGLPNTIDVARYHSLSLLRQQALRLLSMATVQLRQSAARQIASKHSELKLTASRRL